MALLLAKVAKRDAYGVLATQLRVTHEESSAGVDALDDALIQRVERPRIVEPRWMRAQADDAERCGCEQLEVSLTFDPPRDHRRVLAVLADALGERVGAEMTDDHPQLERPHATAE